MLNLLEIALWMLVLVWLVSLLLTLYGLARQKPVSPSNDEASFSTSMPFVSVLVPARNEARRALRASIQSILAQDYPRFEVIAVNDRSTDDTGAILQSLAQADQRLRVVEGEELPAGWLGKPFAMHQAFCHARGEWILATDADMIFHKSALRTALNHAEALRADALTLIPYFEAGSFWERVMIPTWAWVSLMFTVVYRINNPKSAAALGIGGFFLLRRRVVEQVGGYETLKDEVLEDVRLAEIIKRSGARVLAEYAPGLVRTRMYENFSEMRESCTKNWFAGMKFSVPFALLCVFGMYFISILPAAAVALSLVGIVAGDRTLTPLLIPASLAWMLQVLILIILSFRSNTSSIYAFTAPLGLALLYTMLLDSTLRIATGRGVKWKGRSVYERTGVSPPDVATIASRIAQIDK